MFRITSTKLLTLTVSIASFVWTTANAASCVVFDANWNLYAFGINGADYNLGGESSWASGSATKLTTTGRPPFDGGNTQCFLSQFQNTIYVIDGDNANPSNIHLYDATAQTWSTQSITLAGVDPTSLVAILDHDTNVFFALSGGTLYQLDFGTMKAATGSPISWQSVEAPSFSVTNYNPVMALAQNHIHFLDVPGTSPGDAFIFVIHFAYFQPEKQNYPAASGSTFPVSHGKATSFFLDSTWQEQFAFIPDDGSATYVVNVQTNTTVPLAGPSNKSSGSSYAASTSALVQLTSTNNLFYIPYSQTGTAASNANAAWQSISLSGFPSGTPNNSTSSPSSTSHASSTGSSTNTRITSSPSKTGSSSSTSSSTSKPSSGAEKNFVAGGAVCGLAALLALFSL